MPNVGFVREDVRKRLPQYELIRDCLAGEAQVKYRKTRYLPMPNPEDTSADNIARYDSYITRASFFGVAEKTLSDLVGQIFMREPAVEIPAMLQPVIDDATGSGIPLQQQAQLAAANALGYGRLGLYVDYPSTAVINDDGTETDEPASIADIEAGEIRPTIRVIEPWDCINYRVKTRGAKIILSLVVFREDRIVEDDGFETKKKDQWRVLRLDENDEYVIDIYYNKTGTTPNERYEPRDAAGNRLDEIPFTFVGSVNNDPAPNAPPMYQLCSLNIHHYMNSADYEESVFVVGQPTIAASGLTEEWVTKVLGGRISMGARGGIPLPVNGSIELLQAEPNTLAKEAMDHKEDQMMSIGAKFRRPDQVQRTATESSIDNVAETSTLSRVAQNVAAGFKWALEWCAVFVGASEAGIKFDMNTEFDLVALTPEEQAQIIQAWKDGAIAFEEMRAALRRGGVATLDDKKAKAAIEEEQAAMVKLEIDKAGGIAEASNLPDPNPEPAA
jgi:hypothetical protein